MEEPIKENSKEISKEENSDKKSKRKSIVLSPSTSVDVSENFGGKFFSIVCNNKNFPANFGFVNEFSRKKIRKKKKRNRKVLR